MINSFDHEKRAHNSKTNLKRMDWSKTMLKREIFKAYIQQFNFFLRFLIIYDELKPKVWPSSCFWPSKEDEHLKSWKVGFGFANVMVWDFYNFSKYNMSQRLEFYTIVIRGLLKTSISSDHYFHAQLIKEQKKDCPNVHCSIVHKQ